MKDNEWKFGSKGFTTPDGFSWSIMPAGTLKRDFPEKHLERLEACMKVMQAIKDPEAVEIATWIIATLQTWRMGPGVGFNVPIVGQEGMTLENALDLFMLKAGVPIK